ncbi:hypothetical protein F442_03676 [Phytophthora nicotianae P10297]|uniref:Uncharacterized protein n=1 Tax=Phytophthora nicotianae P10297 TaxID=1317064 RepID=W2ZUX4_PHYNI|nr:hypothetical protein F442_03676 [Phytophthora nicotianae P10297]
MLPANFEMIAFLRVNRKMWNASTLIEKEDHLSPILDVTLLSEACAEARRLQRTTAMAYGSCAAAGALVAVMATSRIAAILSAVVNERGEDVEGFKLKDSTRISKANMFRDV